MSEGFEDDDEKLRAMLGLAEHLKKKEKKIKVKRCVALNKLSKRCRNRAKKGKDYCEIHLLKLFGEKEEDLETIKESENSESDSDSSTGKVIFVDNSMIAKRRMISHRIPNKPIEIDDFTEKYLIQDLEAFVDHSDRVDPIQMSIYDYIQKMNLQDSLKEKPVAKASSFEFDDESKLQLDAIRKYGAGAVSGDKMDEAFQNGTLEKKYFQILKSIRPEKYMDVDMDEEFERILKEKRRKIAASRA